MKIRRVVTGLDASGRAAVVSDGPAPRSHDLVKVPGMSTSMLWATAPGEPIRRDGSDPTPGVRRQLPEPGGTCFLIIRFPSDSVFAAPSFDAAAARVSRRGESHPPPLSGPDVTVSRHPAPTVRRWVNAMSCQWANRP